MVCCKSRSAWYYVVLEINFFSSPELFLFGFEVDIFFLISTTFTKEFGTHLSTFVTSLKCILKNAYSDPCYQVLKDRNQQQFCKQFYFLKIIYSSSFFFFVLNLFSLLWDMVRRRKKHNINQKNTNLDYMGLSREKMLLCSILMKQNIAPFNIFSLVTVTGNCGKCCSICKCKHID